MRTEASGSWLRALDRRVGALVSPGDLALAHGELEGVSGCTGCHAGLERTPDALCLECHGEVGARMEERVGVHGRFEGACVGCHAEHRGASVDLTGLDRAAFNHERALFPLRGAHRDADCESCHLRSGGEGLPRRFHALDVPHDRCATCHEDVHGPAFLAGRDCGACHGEASFGATALRPAADGDGGFDHAADTGLPLDGAHAALACGDCHTDARRRRVEEEGLAPGRAVPSDCAGCHADPHESALGRDCGACHGTAAWRGEALAFDHDRDTAFALDADHAGLACEGCHADARFRAESTRCAGCHAPAAALLAGRFGGRRAAPDPHFERVDCAECHEPARGGPHLAQLARACLDCHAEEYADLLHTQKRLLDGLGVRAEAALERRSRAALRGDAAPLAEEEAIAVELDALARLGAHNFGLAELLLQDAIARLGPASSSARRGEGAR